MRGQETDRVARDTRLRSHQNLGLRRCGRRGLGVDSTWLLRHVEQGIHQCALAHVWPPKNENAREFLRRRSRANDGWVLKVFSKGCQQACHCRHALVLSDGAVNRLAQRHVFYVVRLQGLDVALGLVCEKQRGLVLPLQPTREV